MCFRLSIRSLKPLVILLSVGLGACATPPAEPPAPEPHDAFIVEVAPTVSPEPVPPAEPLVEVPPDDLWERMRRGFALPSLAAHPRVQERLEWHREHPEYLALVSARAEPFLYFVLEEIERREMPTEIALLPVIESGYVPSAYSRSNAAGMWQFIPSTGWLYGLKQNWWYDGRRDVYASTHAALDYLEKLHEHFAGNWLLALAAYNGGPGAVGRAIERNLRNGQPTDYWHLDLSRETERYLPKLLAVKALVEDPASFRMSLTPIPNAPYLVTVDIESQIDLALAAELAEVDLETLYQLNPGFNRWATDPDGPHRLLLPVDNAETFLARLAELPPDERITWLRHEIAPGDTLSEIARRYRTTVQLLQQTNRLASSRIRAGHHLLVPQPAPSLQSRTMAAVQPGAGARFASEPPPITHVVARGESLWGIAHRYGVGVQALASWNAMTPGDVLKAGATLAVLNQDLGAGPPGSAVRTVSYAVQRGDSLYAIAQRFSVSIADLRRWNDLHQSNLLHPGQALTVHVNETRVGL